MRRMPRLAKVLADQAYRAEALAAWIKENCRWALETSGDADEWAAGLGTATTTPRRIDPPASDAYSWDRTAGIVSGVLEQMLL